MDIGYCLKCNSTFTKKKNGLPIEEYLCPSCLEVWYKFYDKNHNEFGTNPIYKEISNPTWQMWIGRLSIKEKVEFT